MARDVGGFCGIVLTTASGLRVERYWTPAMITSAATQAATTSDRRLSRRWPLDSPALMPGWLPVRRAPATPLAGACSLRAWASDTCDRWRPRARVARPPQRLSLLPPGFPRAGSRPRPHAVHHADAG